MTENAMLRLNSHVKRTNRGDDHSAFRRNGFAMVILIVLMVLMRMSPCITAQPLSHARMINSPARTDVASTKDGLAIMTTIVVTVLMKENSVTLNTKRARLRNLLVRTSNVFELNTDAVSASSIDQLINIQIYSDFCRRRRRLW